MRMERSSIFLLALLLSACGTNTTQRAATGGLTGAAIGGIVGGPIGMAVGGAVGAGGGALMPESADQMAMDIFHGKGVTASSEQPAESAGSGMTSHPSAGTSQPPPPPPARSKAPTGPGMASTSVQITPDVVRQMQTNLKDQGLYDGPVDGIIGPRTRSGLANLEARDGVSGINLETMQMLVGQGSGDSNGPSNVPPPAPGR
jgi:hypothetical protein